MRVLLLIAFVALLSLPIAAKDGPAPEECLASGKKTARVTVAHSGKSYALASEACRDQFLTDPERYAQLYDALAELEAAGTPLAAAPETASLVPS